MTFLEQALEVTSSDAERADILERAGEAAIASAHQVRAEELLLEAQEIRERLGDRVGLARVVGLRARALFLIPRRDAAIALVEETLPRFADMPDEPAVVSLLSGLATAYSSQGHYDKARDASDRAHAAAERLGDTELAATNLATKGAMAFYAGRLWESRALFEGAARLAREHGHLEMEIGINNQLTNLLALDDVRATLEIERATVALARRLGQRTRESVVLGNAAEDARRTGEWDWAVDELQATRSNDMDPSTRLMLDMGLATYGLLRGEQGEDDVRPVMDAAKEISDRDISSSARDIAAVAACVRGEWAAAAAEWRAQAATSDLNKPYALPRAGYAAMMAGDAVAAQQVLDDLAVLGSRGRAIEADQAHIRAGIAALQGDEAAALAGFRSALGAYRELGLVGDEAMLGLSAGTRLGVDSPEVRAWIESARDTFARLRARPYQAMAAALLEGKAAGGARTDGRGAAPATSADQPASSPSRT